MIKLKFSQKKKLLELMQNSARKGNLANAAIVLENGEEIAASESWVASSCDATAHSERMLVEMVCKQRLKNFTPGLQMITVVEPCLMCMSACSQAGYEEIGFIIPAEKYINEISWMSDVKDINKFAIAKKFCNPIKLSRLKRYAKEFEKVFEKVMGIEK